MKKARILSLILALVMMFSFVLTSCIKPSPDTGDTGDDSNTPGDNNQPETPKEFDLPYAEGTVLRMATGYNSVETGLSFHANVFPAGESSITLADGKTYNVGDLKPTWVQVEKVLNVDFEDKYTGKSASDEFK